MKLMSRAAANRSNVEKHATHWLGCGVCLGCRDEQNATWALRLQHEARSHSRNTFLTLTYDDDHLPEGLQIPHMQTFWKMLRKNIPEKIKHFYCGEYGDKTKREHYHAAVFGLNAMGDEKRWDAENFTSEILNKIWGKGVVTISELTPDRMAYVAGYVLKKAGYKKQHYLVAGDDGIMKEVQPPFRRMSRGLGENWLTKFGNDLRLGYVDHDDRKLPIPRYYRDKLKNTELGEMIKAVNDAEREKRPPPDPERLKAAERIRQLRLKTARRRDRI